VSAADAGRRVERDVSGSAAPAFGSWLDQFFASYYRYRPVNATFVGVHAYDDRLPDYSEQGMAAVLDDARTQLERLKALPAEALSASGALDRQLAQGFLEIQCWESRSAQSEALKNSLFPGAACMYLVGWDGLWHLRRETQAREGRAFSLRAFHDRVLSFGSVPVTLIAQAMRASGKLAVRAHR